MKTVKAIVMSVLCALTCLSYVGCNFRGGGPIAGTAGEISLNYFLGGFGDAYIKAVVEDYTKNVNTSAKIRLIPRGSNASSLDKIKADTGNDIYIANTNFFGLQDHLLNIDDVFDMEVYGETGVKVKDKVDTRMYDYFAEKGGHYQFPQNNLTGYRWVYNKTLLDEKLGTYTLPRTTDEFFEIGDALFGKGVYLTATALGNGAKVYEDYLEYAFRTWFMQMTGVEAYDKYYDGMYKKNGEWFRDETSPDALIDANATAIEAAYSVAKKLATPASGSSDTQYLHKGCTGFGYKDVDVVFYGGMVNGTKQLPFAFMFSGNWLEREVAEYESIGVIDTSDREIVPIKTPVISAITERTSFKGEDTLRAVIDYVDGVSGATLPAGVTEDDVAIVTEARNAAPKGLEEVILVTKNTRYPDLCKDFLRYLVSDRAQKIAAQNCSGISILPYGYEPTDEDMGFEISSYIKKFNELSEDVVLVDLTHGNQLFTQKSGMQWYGDTSVIASNRLAKVFFTNSSRAPAVSSIVTQTKSKFRTLWSSAVNEYKAAL